MPQRIAAAVVTAAVLGGPAAAAQQGAPAGEWPAYGGDHGSTKSTNHGAHARTFGVAAAPRRPRPRGVAG
jgi:hypothetical protein